MTFVLKYKRLSYYSIHLLPQCQAVCFFNELQSPKHGTSNMSLVIGVYTYGGQCLISHDAITQGSWLFSMLSLCEINAYSHDNGKE